MNILINVILFFLKPWVLVLLGVIFLVLGVGELGAVLLILGAVFMGKRGIVDKRFKSGFRPSDWGKK